MKPSATGTIAVHTELAITEKFASSLRTTTDSKAPNPSSPIDSTSRPRWVRSVRRPAEVDERERSRPPRPPSDPQSIAGAPPEPLAEQQSGGDPDRGHHGQHPADVGSPDRHPVDEDGHHQHAERDGGGVAPPGQAPDSSPQSRNAAPAYWPKARLPIPANRPPTVGE